jgi:hypothetical protein
MDKLEMKKLRARVTAQYKEEKRDLLLALDKKYRQKMSAIEKLAGILEDVVPVDKAHGQGMKKPKYGNAGRVYLLIERLPFNCKFTTRDLYDLAVKEEPKTLLQTVCAEVSKLHLSKCGLFSPTGEKRGKSVVFVRKSIFLTDHQAEVTRV